MLGVRLKPEEEDRLARHARELGRTKSAIVREWIVEKLDRETTDALVARAAARIAAADRGRRDDGGERLDRWLDALDAEDGGYDWGSEGPPG
ncbi:hypothetical protein ASG29_06045 [Sphingomonas sp. Leaf412]|uniref:ribbon-helix-helix domain-containing protein n=1 Tax=Sphingomonas sp. Leaf412 TaxID=1736370 RepID=UPI0006F3B125|nr:CopG family transcriptional regulator [Sphingomonas sp. Leaf412]KQT33588.1 hypothetical protein ASG29_06045 [Sphingomonas sp. Leaf412]